MIEVDVPRVRDSEGQCRERRESFRSRIVSARECHLSCLVSFEIRLDLRGAVP